MNNLIDNRHIRVFISSTFRDMQDERDYLMQCTFPKLRKLAAERDVTLTELDLRWGITEEEAKSGKVVEICLREIENSIPFFIGIIGNRYGWVPTKEDLGDNVTERFTDVNKYIEQHLSVTEMEMQFGVLSRDEDMHAYFYIKEQNDEADNPEMLNRLKEEVSKSKYPSSGYKTPEDLAIQVEEAFINLLNTLFPKGNLTELEKERIGQRSFMNQLCQNYIKDDNSFEILNSWLADATSRLYVVTGASGLGKSALIANWLKEKLNHSDHGYNIIYHFTGNGGSESSYEYITKSIANEINDLYGWEDPDSKSNLDDLFVRVSSESSKPLLIVIDAINQIVDVDNAKLLNWLPIPTKNIKILFSTLEDDRTMEVFKKRHYPIFNLQALNHERRSQLVKSYLKLYAKSLSDKQVDSIVNNPLCENTLVLKTLLDELINFGIYEKLDERIEFYLKAETIDDFYQALLESYECTFEFSSDALCQLALTKHGLKETEILSVINISRPEEFRINQFHLSALLCCLKSHLCEKNGMITFAHTYFSSSVYKRYIENNDIAAYTVRDDIISYFEGDGMPRLDARAISEVAYLKYQQTLLPFTPSSIQTKFDNPECDKLYCFIAQPYVFCSLYKTSPYDLAKYWNQLAYGDMGNHPISIIMDIDDIEPSLIEFQFDACKMAVCFCRDYLDDYESAYQFANILLIIAESSKSKKLLAIANTEVGLCYNMYPEMLYKGLEYLKKAGEIVSDSKDEIDIECQINIYKSISKTLIKNWKKLSKPEYPGSYIEKALELIKQTYGVHSLEYAQIEEMYGEMLTLWNGWPRAIDSYKKCLEIKIQMAGEESIPVADTYVNIGKALPHTLFATNGIEHLNKALMVYDKYLGHEHTKTIEVKIEIAEQSLILKQPDVALKFYTEALNTLKGKDNLLYIDKIIEILTYCGHAYVELRDYPKAQEYYESAYQESQKYRKVSNFYHSFYLFQIGKALYLNNDTFKGIERFKESITYMEMTNNDRELKKHFKRIISVLESALKTINDNEERCQIALFLDYCNKQIE